MIIGPEPKNDPLVFWGPRHASEAGGQLVGWIHDGRYRASTSEMNRFVGEVRNAKARVFRKAAEDYLAQHTNWHLHAEVFIGPDKSLPAQEDLGDIDILGIDETCHRMFSIECKNISHGRNPHEIATEIGKLLGKHKEEDSLLGKHLRRHEWLVENIETVMSVYGLQGKKYEVVSVLLTSKELATPYLRAMPIPCLSFAKLEREGTAAFLESEPGSS